MLIFTLDRLEMVQLVQECLQKSLMYCICSLWKVLQHTLLWITKAGFHPLQRPHNRVIPGAAAMGELNATYSPLQTVLSWLRQTHHAISFNRTKIETLAVFKLNEPWAWFLWETPLFLCSKEWFLRKKPLDAACWNMKAFQGGIRYGIHAWNRPFSPP